MTAGVLWGGRGTLCLLGFCSRCCLCTGMCRSLPLWRHESTPSLTVPARLSCFSKVHYYTDSCLGTASCSFRASLVAQTVKNSSAMWETWVRSLGGQDPLEGGVAPHSSILAWRIPMERGAWWTTALGVAKSQTQLSN